MTDVDWHARFDARGIGWYCGFMVPFPEGTFQVTEAMLFEQPRCDTWHPTRAARGACTHGAAVPLVNGAVLSEDGVYRYVLYREWPDGTGTALWIMLNPSTADADVDDPTIRRCRDFSQRWGYRRMRVVNLYAYRAPDPATLKAMSANIVGPENRNVVNEEIAKADFVVCAWGANPIVRSLHKPDVVTLAGIHGKDLWCLGMTSGDQPKHPLYVAARTKPILWRSKNG